MPDVVRSLRPSGSRRSGKRDLIVNLFLAQKGQLGPDELAALVCREDAAVSRATVYRTLRWMVDAGIARRVDVGDGRVRFEHSYRQPRHFHLICKSCNGTFEFLSSDIEALVDEVAAARQFAPRQVVLQIYGTCEACRAGRPAAAVPPPADAVFVRDALRIALATARSGRAFYARAARLSADARARRTFEQLAADEQAHLAALEARYQTLVEGEPQLESQPTFLFFKDAAHGLFAAGTEELVSGVDARQALAIAVRCERGSHRFFKRYGDRFDESEGKRVFLDVADEERRHLERVLRESRVAAARARRGARHGAGRRSA
jgi:Fur family ferric uptake transcriptional regulator